MAKTISIVNNGGGKYTITDSDNQTRVVDQSQAAQESAKSGVRIITTGPAGSQGTLGFSTGFTNSAGSNYPTDPTAEKTVLINGKATPVAQAVAQAYSATNLGKIRTNLIKYNQLTKAEARDPNNLLNKWAQIVYGAANDPDPKNNDPFVYAAALQKQGFGTVAGAGGYTGPMIYPRLTNKEDAKATIVGLFKSLLNREPTDKEVSDATKALNADENKKENYQTQTPILNSAGQITGYRASGGTNPNQFLTDYLTSKFPKETGEVKTQAPDVTQLAKDKKVYEGLIAAAAGDAEKINEANRTTNYGRTLSEYTAAIADKIKTAGATNDQSSVSSIAKYLLDNALSPNSKSAQSYINKNLQFGKGTVEAGGKPADVYTGTAGSNVESLKRVALANGLDLNKVFDESTLNSVLSAVNAGEDISTYARIIRDAAKVAWNVPDNVAKLMDQGVSLDAIYAPYKNTFASTLELNPNDVTLSDLAKFGVIGQQAQGSQAPQNLYDFQKALRKDNRWQYTSQAREEVSQGVQRVLKDFGFMG